MKTKPEPGTRVRFTSRFLKSIGIYTGRAPRDKWLGQACACSLCSTGDFICTNEPSACYAGTPEGAVPTYRHIAFENLEVCK